MVRKLPLQTYELTNLQTYELTLSKKQHTVEVKEIVYININIYIYYFFEIHFPPFDPFLQILNVSS